ncbi:nuclear transport factor 2 family protein [Gordonia shandongensis]|uniref:nuclear transport factor 2 family protein n=1 Tax=Gordonia shandongensis TaxID=376351 RepID=UPI00040876B1|nr:nuclear transport factor 2 family protein [Gordonia shandongensis]
MTAEQQETGLSDKIAATVQAYIDGLNTGSADDIVALFADGATVEDPIGTPVRSTRDELLEFYGVVTGLDSRSATLAWTRIAGDTAVFEFTLVTGTGGMTFQITPIDIMTFDDDGKIRTMRAVWEQSDLTQV